MRKEECFGAIDHGFDQYVISWMNDEEDILFLERAGLVEKRQNMGGVTQD
jgi:hypothetical protein